MDAQAPKKGDVSMSRSPAEKEARKKYRREKCRVIKLTFYPTEQDMIEKINAVPSYSQYIKSLIKADLERS